MAAIPEIKYDGTLMDVDLALEAKQKLEASRSYLGMSIIGDECWRKLFYTFRQVANREISAQGIKVVQDGYVQEKIMADRLKMLPYVQLHTEDPQNPGHQIHFTSLLGHFNGNCDGMICGIKESPKTWHVWEAKAVNDKKFDKLISLREEKGEKNSLIEWDMIYYTQAQAYMHFSQTDRHYLTVVSPGGRRYISVRTEYNKAFAENAIEKAKTIIFDNWNIPAKLSDKKEFYKCKWCEYSEVCHDSKVPFVNCKTCRYSEPINNGRRQCLFKNETLNDSMLLIDTCPNHVFNPALMPAKLIEHQQDCCIYRLDNGIQFSNCSITGFPDMKNNLDYIYTSQDLYNKVKFLTNLTDTTIKVQKEFDGTFVEDKKPVKKAWEYDERLKGI
jgi:hypothetical protein